MKKSIKICLWLSLILCIIGFSVVGVSAAFGAAFEIPHIVRNNKFNILDRKFENSATIAEERLDVIEETYVTWQAYEDLGYIDIDAGVTCIDMDIDYGEIMIMEGDKFQFSVYDEYDNFKYEIKSNGTLKIENKRENGSRLFSFGSWEDASETDGIHIDITVPSGTLLKELNIDLGAGNVYINDIRADSIDINSGVGDINVESITSKDVEIETGVGNVYLYLNGKLRDYNYELKTGVGDVSLNGDSVTSFVGSQYEQNNESKQDIKVETGVGEVYVDISEN